MNEITEMCCKIQKNRFPCIIGEVTYDSLTSFVHQISTNALPFSARYTDCRQSKCIYTCTFQSCSAKLVFKHDKDFYDNDYYTFDLQSSFLQHSNHLLNPRFIEAHRNCYSQKTCDEIRYQTAIGVLPGRIRSNLDVECSSQIFYNIRRPVINETKKEDLESLIESLEKGKEKRVKVNKNSAKKPTEQP